ncbi:MAG: hypothetical protein AB7P16_28640 [Bradyrhizobium sp.]|uniref:hypothetical protein n=1 Tax=Bradyrhizobium sp. TaxID=376 RepID=UPI003D12DA91
MAKFETFAEDIRLATAGIAPEAVSAELAKLAKTELGRAVSSGAASPIYTRYVNGREGAAEESVEAPGPILYVFSWWKLVINFALEELGKASPRLTGRYQASHVVMVGGRTVDPASDIPAEAEVMIINTQPYARKIEVGHMRMTVPDGVYEAVRSKVVRRFGGEAGPVQVRKRMVMLPGGYVLKGRFRRGYKSFARTKLRRDTKAGQPITYPALVMSMKVAGGLL